MFVFPHCVYVDKDRNIWVTDAMGGNGNARPDPAIHLFEFGPAGMP